MASFSRIETFYKIKSSGLVPVFYNPLPHVVVDVIDACQKGGVKAIEFTNRGDGAHKVLEKSIEEIRKNWPEMAIGVGSVLDAGTASIYLQIGVDFIVSPALLEDVAIVCNRRKVLWAPGCGSVTEIVRAHELGAELIKIFPAKEVGGPSFISAVKGPMPWTHIMPTGGVSPSEENLKSWFDAGALCVGMGSKLISTEVMKGLDSNDTNEVKNRLADDISNIVAVISQLKK